MTDLELTKLCAEAMGYTLSETQPRAEDREVWTVEEVSTDENNFFVYRPLHDDAQAMALVKNFALHIDQRPGTSCSVQDPHFKYCFERKDSDLNRAICECIAKMQAAYVKI